jgi:GAF domain-containing protein
MRVTLIAGGRCPRPIRVCTVSLKCSTYGFAHCHRALGPPLVDTCAQALYRGEAVTSEDLSADTRFAEEWIRLCADHGIRSCRSQPVRTAQGAPLGTFILCFPEPRTFDRFDEKLIAACAQVVEVTPERRRTRGQQEIMIGELQHRMRNLFGSVGAIVQLSATVTWMSPPFKGHSTAD